MKSKVFAPSSKPSTLAGARRHHRKGQAGLSLVEVVAAMTIAALAAGGALAMFNSASTAQRIDNVSDGVVALMVGTRALHSTAGNYGAAGLNLALVNGGKVPSNFTTSITGAGAQAAANITSDLGNAVTVTGANANFTILLAGVSRDACIALATKAIPNARLAIGALAAAPMPIAAATANTSCDAANQNMTYTFS